MPPDDPDYRVGELIRRLDRLEIEFRTGMGRIEARLDARVMSVDVYQAEKLAAQIQVGNIERRMGGLEEAREAMQKLILGAFIGLVTNTVGLLIVYAILRK